MRAEEGSKETRGERHKMAQGRGRRQEEGGRPAVSRRQERNNRAGGKGATDLGFNSPVGKSWEKHPMFRAKLVKWEGLSIKGETEDPMIRKERCVGREGPETKGRTRKSFGN